MLLDRVPTILSISTFIVVVILLALAFFIYKGYSIAIHIGGVLGILAIISSATARSHNTALLEFGTSTYITILDILMILGFYLFPAIYIYFWIRKYVIRRK